MKQIINKILFLLVISCTMISCMKTPLIDQMLPPTLTLGTPSVVGNSVTLSSSYTGNISGAGFILSEDMSFTSESKYSSSSFSSGQFQTSITGLKFGTKYYYKSYVSNMSGSVESSSNSFMIGSNTELPTVVTEDDLVISSTTAECGGNVTASGGAEVTSRGVCWGQSVDPTTDDTHKEVGSGTGSFTTTITGLTPQTRYYVRAYAVNSVGTAYGESILFTTMNDYDAEREALLAFYNSTDGPNWINRTNWCSTQPISDWYGITVTDGYVTKIDMPNNALSGGITSEISSLSHLTSLRVHNDEADNTAQVSSVRADYNKLTFIDLSGNTALTELYCYSNQLTTLDIRNLPNLGRNVYVGNQTNSAGEPIDMSLFMTEDQKSQWNSTWSTSDDNDQVNSTTTPLIVITAEVHNIAESSATSGGTIVAPTGTSVTARGVCWSTSTNPSVSLSTKTVDGTGDGTFTSSITGLSVGVTYYVRAYATSSEGTVYGDQKSFTTEDTQRDALVAFYNATGGANWVNSTNWCSSEPISEWYGVTVENGYVTEITMRNNNLTGVISSDIAALRYLSHLDVIDNKITSIDISGSTSLTCLYCGDNQLTSLDVSSNTFLSNLWCYANQLTSLDVSSNTSLTRLDCSFNQLTSLDVSNNTALTDLYCYGNRISIIDIRNLVNLGENVSVGSQTNASDEQCYLSLFLTASQYSNKWTPTWSSRAENTRVNLYTSDITVTTAAVTNITTTSATSGGTIVAAPGSTVTARGVCWSTSENPTIDLSTKTSDGTGDGTFTSTITGLTTGVTYYVRAYAKCSSGTFYGEQMVFVAAQSSDNDGMGDGGNFEW